MEVACRCWNEEISLFKNPSDLSPLNTVTIGGESHECHICIVRSYQGRESPKDRLPGRRVEVEREKVRLETVKVGRE